MPWRSVQPFQRNFYSYSGVILGRSRPDVCFVDVLTVISQRTSLLTLLVPSECKISHHFTTHLLGVLSVIRPAKGFLRCLVTVAAGGIVHSSQFSMAVSD